jgi:hypothetical protein
MAKHNTEERVYPVSVAPLLKIAVQYGMGIFMVYVLHIHRDFWQQQQQNIWKC